MKRLVWIGLLVTLLLAACQPAQPVAQSRGAATIETMSVKELKTQLDKKDFPLINVHIPYEGEIEKTDAFIDYREIDKHLDQLPKDKNAKIVLYCRSGRMSHIAADMLVKLGYTNVYDVEGGMLAWEEAGYPLIRK
jgi:rhodanese-related sulfurtransferase